MGRNAGRGYRGVGGLGHLDGDSGPSFSRTEMVYLGNLLWWPIGRFVFRLVETL